VKKVTEFTIDRSKLTRGGLEVDGCFCPLGQYALACGVSRRLLTTDVAGVYTDLAETLGSDLKKIWWANDILTNDISRNEAAVVAAFAEAGVTAKYEGSRPALT
jgi:hypothetical protein